MPYDCLVCHRPFCQRCSQIWHPNLTCDLASAQRAAQDPTLEMLMKSSSHGGQIRPCPRCKCCFRLSFEEGEKKETSFTSRSIICLENVIEQIKEKQKNINVCLRLVEHDHLHLFFPFPS